MITFRNTTTGQEINVGNVKKAADGRIFFSVRNAGCGTRFLNRNICLTLNEQVENGTFYKTRTYEEANNLLLHGDKKLAKEIEDAGVAKTRLKLKTQQTRRQLFSTVVGVAPNVPTII